MLKSPYVGPRCLLDPWDKSFFDTFTEEEASRIAWTDHEAIIKYPSEAWIYDKALLARELGLPYWTTPQKSSQGLFVRPRVNLFGMGAGAAPADIPIEVEDPVWTPLYTGTHLSWDMFVKRGRVQAWTCFRGIKNTRGSFSYWERLNLPLSQAALSVVRLLPNYTGLLNVESIGGKVIEAHLRGSLQFKNLSSGLFEFAVGRSSGVDSFKPGFSYVVRVNQDCKPRLENPPPLPLKVLSYECVWSPGGWLSEESQDEISYVLFFVNGTSLHECQRFGKILFRRTLLRRRN